jgi:hypothetical protein
MVTVDPVLLSWLPIASLVVAGLAVFFGPLITWIVAKRQMQTALAVAHKQVIAPMRQQWTNSLRDHVAEIISLAAGFYRTYMLAQDQAQADAQKHDNTIRLVLLIQQVELMLNPNEDLHNELFRGLDNLRKTAWNASKTDEFPAAVARVSECCKKVLKTEWERVKDDT